ncbi:MAG: hypothetical protein IKX37_02595 [Bacteroidales bacterium]|nr:hypothetical protein [Bacteroidales bacterium]
MSFVRPVSRILPDGNVAEVMPYHISFEGLEQVIICRDDEDCDAMVKCIFVCAQRKNVIVIIYAVVSNHSHIAVLAAERDAAVSFAREVKRTYSQLFRRKYGETKVLYRTDVDVQLLDTEWYLRNALAYIPRNAFDNGAENLWDYRWTGFRAMFRTSQATSYPHTWRLVSSLSKRERERIMRTGDDLKKVRWMINERDELEPSGACDSKYLEDAFNKDQSFFFKCIGTVNVGEMTQRLIIAPRKKSTDAEFFKEIEALARQWYQHGVNELPYTTKARMIPYVFRTMKTSIPQMSRGFGLSREVVAKLLRKP